VSIDILPDERYFPKANVGWLASGEGASAIVKGPARYPNTRLLIILMAVAEL
jgi:hypothetical protein